MGKSDYTESTVAPYLSPTRWAPPGTLELSDLVPGLWVDVHYRGESPPTVASHLVISPPTYGTVNLLRADTFDELTEAQRAELRDQMAALRTGEYSHYPVYSRNLADLGLEPTADDLWNNSYRVSRSAVQRSNVI